MLEERRARPLVIHSFLEWVAKDSPLPNPKPPYPLGHVRVLPAVGAGVGWEQLHGLHRTPCWHSTLTVGVKPAALPDGVPVPDILPAAPPR